MFNGVIKKTLVLEKNFNDIVKDKLGEKIDLEIINPALQVTKKLERTFEIQDNVEKKIRKTLSDLRAIK